MPPGTMAPPISMPAVDDLVDVGGSLIPRSVAQALGLLGVPEPQQVASAPPPAPDLAAPPPADPAVWGRAPTEQPTRDRDVLVERETEVTPGLADRQRMAEEEAAAAESERRAQGTGAPPPPQNLLGTTYGDVLAEQGAALDDEAASVKRAGEVESAKASDVAAAYEERNQSLDALQAEREAKIREDQAQLQKTQGELEAAQKRLADKKIDRNRLWHQAGTGKKILAGIAVALSGLGSALKHQGDRNPALEMILGAMKEDVDLQFKERDALAQEVDMKRGMIDLAIQTSNHRQAQYQLAMAGYTERAAREVEAIAASAEEPLARERAAQLSAQLRLKGSEFLGQAVQLEHSEWQQGQDRLQRERDSKRQAGVAYARIKEDRRQFDKNLEQRQAETALNYDLKIREMDGEREKLAAEAAAKGDTKTAEDIRARGVPDLYSGEGDKRQIYMARDDKTATAVAQKKAAVDTILTLTDEIVRLRDKHGGEADQLRSEAWRKMKANEAAIANAVRVADEMGALDKGALEQIQKLMGTPDVTEFATRSSDAAEGLIQMRKNVLAKFNDYAKAVRDPLAPDYVDYNPTKRYREKGPNANAVDKAYEVIVSEKTPDEIIAGAEPGAAKKAVRKFGYALAGGDDPGTDAQDNAKKNAEAVDDPSFGSLVSKKQGDALRVLVGKAKGEGGEADEARDVLLDLAANGSRPDVANAAARALKENFGADAIDAAIARTEDEDWKASLGGLRDFKGIGPKDRSGVRDPKPAEPSAEQKAKDKIQGRSSDYVMPGKAEKTTKGYKPDVGETAVAERAKGGDQKAIADLLKLVSQGGDRGLWAQKQIIEAGKRKKK